MELGPIGVVQEHRGKKLGKVLMEECLSRLIDMNKIDSYLEVDITNTPAINLYESYGFKEVSKKHGFLFRLKNEK
jgi:ribosomal-protein-alanine N-acetyltransferase